jgi:hypothetical protein
MPPLTEGFGAVAHIASPIIPEVRDEAKMRQKPCNFAMTLLFAPDSVPDRLSQPRQPTCGDSAAHKQ